MGVLNGRFTPADLDQLPFTRQIFDGDAAPYPPAWLITSAVLADDEIGRHTDPSTQHSHPQPLCHASPSRLLAGTRWALIRRDLERPFTRTVMALPTSPFGRWVTPLHR
ncbi:MAG: hypothetical protein R3E31_06095 [Chloroflexota bacterium]